MYNIYIDRAFQIIKSVQTQAYMMCNMKVTLKLQFSLINIIQMGK